jgi:glycosyltransferase involved in cell wall biosynthesis
LFSATADTLNTRLTLPPESHTLEAMDERLGGGGISVFFPAYNDSATIASVVIAVMQTLPSLTSDFEVIVVDDGSRDSTATILQDLQRLYPEHLRVESHIRNRGYGGAVRTGIVSSTKDWVFYTDGDAQYDVRELALLVERAAAGIDDIDVVNGYKISRSDPAYRKAIGWVYNLFVHAAFHVQIRDIDCDFRLMRRSLLEKIHLESSSGTICVEMIKKLEDAGARFAEVPVHHFHRSAGRSQFFRPYWLWKTFRDLLSLWHKLMWSRPIEDIRPHAVSESQSSGHRGTGLPR